MLLKIFKNKKAQNTAEYAILIGLVIGAVVAMQQYAQRTIQARIRDANVTFRDQTKALGESLQYEPYYSESNSNTQKDTNTEETLTSKGSNSEVNKESWETISYNGAEFGVEDENPIVPDDLEDPDAPDVEE